MQQGITKLGMEKTEYSYKNPSIQILETFENPSPGREYIIELRFPEFTSLCPKTGQPDFGEITIYYTPKEWCIESKSFKLYLFAFRQYGAFMESITNKIFNDCWTACSPSWMKVVGKFNPRGGMYITVAVEKK